MTTAMPSRERKAALRVLRRLNKKAKSVEVGLQVFQAKPVIDAERAAAMKPMQSAAAPTPSATQAVHMQSADHL